MTKDNTGDNWIDEVLAESLIAALTTNVIVPLITDMEGRPSVDDIVDKYKEYIKTNYELTSKDLLELRIDLHKVVNYLIAVNDATNKLIETYKFTKTADTVTVDIKTEE